MITLLVAMIAQPAPAPVPPVATAADTAAPVQQAGDPYRAYEAELYEEALAGFVDEEVERPNDPQVLMNVGSAHYGAKNYPEAERYFQKAALSALPPLRAQALYDLGNCAFRQGKLQEAVAFYQGALELAPNDEDAKFNLEYVRNEIRRRHEEAQKRQQQQQGQPQQGEQDQQQAPADQDQDGLPDEIEKSGKNKTDPTKPDSDGDGLPDGAEDKNRNGQVDAQETDPNKKDTDGDGTPDAQDQAAAAQEQPTQPQEGMSAEQADAYLDGMEEKRPGRKVAGQRPRGGKDW